MSRLCRTNPCAAVSGSEVVGEVAQEKKLAIESMTTHGKFSDETISRAKDVFPDPELPAMPIIFVSVHGGEYCARSILLWLQHGVPAFKLVRNIDERSSQTPKWHHFHGFTKANNKLPSRSLSHAQTFMYAFNINRARQYYLSLRGCGV